MAEYLKRSKDKFFVRVSLRKLKSAFKSIEIPSTDVELVKAIKLLAEVTGDESLLIEKRKISTTSEHRDNRLGAINSIKKLVSFGKCIPSVSDFATAVHSFISDTLGLRIDVIENKLYFEPHVPDEWEYVRIKNIRFQNSFIEVRLTKKLNVIQFDFRKRDMRKIDVVFSPAISKFHRVEKVMLNGREGDFSIFETEFDKHIRVQFNLRFEFRVEIYILSES